MIWYDYGYLLEKNKFGENSLITQFFTENHGKISGIIYGATSKKIRNYLQIGNKFYINHNSKNENKLGYLKIEIERIFTPMFFEDKKKLSCILSSMNLIKLLTVDNQSNINIYNLIADFYNFLGNYNWINKLIFWELKLLKLIGYDLELKNIVNEEIIEGKKLYFVSSNNDKKYVPNFLVENNNEVVDFSQISSGLKLITDYLDKSILRPNNISHPKSRIEFLNTIKE
jgi:DNA repair protein RecO (recombination protein O)|tara:strand:+ start:1079 stop:1762 length:684 start_codon:yes stop_codon:yes gene_type:complete